MKKFLFLVLVLFSLFVNIQTVAAVTLAWDPGPTWTSETQVVLLVRTTPTGPASQIPNKFLANSRIAAVSNRYFVLDQTYYVTAVALVDGIMSSESNQVTLVIDDPLADIPVMILIPIPGAPASLKMQ